MVITDIPIRDCFSLSLASGEALKLNYQTFACTFTDMFDAFHSHAGKCHLLIVKQIPG